MHICARIWFIGLDNISGKKLEIKIHHCIWLFHFEIIRMSWKGYSRLICMLVPRALDFNSIWRMGTCVRWILTMLENQKSGMLLLWNCYNQNIQCFVMHTCTYILGFSFYQKRTQSLKNSLKNWPNRKAVTSI